MDNHPSPRFIAMEKERERERERERDRETERQRETETETETERERMVPASECEALQFFWFVRARVCRRVGVCVCEYICVCEHMCVHGCGRMRARAHVFVFEINMYYMSGWYY